MRSRPMLLITGLLVIAGAAYAPVAIARQTVPALAAKSGYSSDARDFAVGRTVYLRSTKTKIGRIIAVDDDHPFPRSFRTANAGRGRAVLLKHTDGPMDWLPVADLTRVYVVR